MNNTFNLSRFGKVFRKHTVDNYRSYLMSVVVLCGIITLVYSYCFFILWDHTIPEVPRRAALGAFYILGGTIFTSAIFADYGNKLRSVVALTLPASHFEKFLAAWLYSFLIFTGVFLVCFYSIDMLFVNASTMPEELKKPLDLFSSDRSYFLFLNYAAFHALALYGALFFKNLHFVKTACLFFVIILILIFTNAQLIKFLFPGEINLSWEPQFGMIKFGDYSNRTSVILDKALATYYRIFVFSGLALILWTGAYFRLQEKQV